MSHALVKGYDELRVSVGYLSDIKIIPKLIMKKTYYIGLDVHKDTVAIASIKSGSRSEAIYHSTCGGSNAAVERALRKLAKQLGVKLQEPHCTDFHE